MRNQDMTHETNPPPMLGVRANSRPMVRSDGGGERLIVKLSPRQQELLDAVNAGASIHHMVGIHASYFRTDTMKSCTATARALEDRGLVKKIKEDWLGYQLVALDQAAAKGSP